MPLIIYNKKRNFKSTAEPNGKLALLKTKLIFVVQRHKASRLHYDFRLEINGVLKSWAVPKGPSLNSADKRLAMMVEDHPYHYKDFKGTIPKGNYGAGIVEIWDHGTFADIDNSQKKTAEKKLNAGIKAGNLKFTLHGRKLKGEFALVKIKGSEDNAWFLIKHKDKFAVNEAYNSEEHTLKNSPINKWLAENKSSAQKSKIASAKKDTAKNSVVVFSDVETTTVKKKEIKTRYLPAPTSKLDKYIQPMLAKEADQPFSHHDWVYEIKWDGYRAIAKVNKKNVSLYSRNGNSFNASYPTVVEALQKLNINAVLDGEVIIVDENGKSNFQKLQHYELGDEQPIEYRVFDALNINGKDITQLTLLERKELLYQLLPKRNNVIKYSEHIAEQGKDFFNLAVSRDLEGIMAKMKDSTYRVGTRSAEWLKIKHHKTTEAVIAGFTKPTGSRKYFGALILALKEAKKLKYIGHIGSGFTQEAIKKLHDILEKIIQENSPFSEKIKTNTPATWVKPQIICEVKFTEWTRDGHLRHPIFLRLREDKKSSEIKMSKAITVSGLATESKSEGKEKVISFGKMEVKTTNLNKVFFPEDKVTKGDVINYYQSISKYILPYLKNRPESLKRNPNGIHEFGFFHKDAGENAPEWIKSFPVESESSNKTIDYIICNDAPTLAYLNNLGCIELNPWHSTIQKPNYPDYLIIDIDPSDNNTFDQVIETANVVKEIFLKANIEGYCKTSGATGLHVYVPTQKKYTYNQLKDFAHLICLIVQEELPDFTTLERNLKKRGSNHIYLDHLQNRRGQTISSVYSLRPKVGATVSMPLNWKEVKNGLSPQNFNIHNALKRIEKTGDIFKGVLGKGINIRKALSILDK
jgi:bifunctional non-homologous end joining protein LigD